MDFHGGILANKPPCYSKICMGEERELNKTHSSRDSCYLYGKIIQVTCPSCYGGDLVKTGLIIARFYCTILINKKKQTGLILCIGVGRPEVGSVKEQEWLSLRQPWD